MDGAPAADNSLLERLNALKPSSVRLTSTSSSKPNAASTIERVKPPSREDALTARLKSLRSQESRGNQDNQGSAFLDSTAPDPDHDVEESAQPHSLQEGPESLTTLTRSEPPAQVTDHDVDPLLFTDDQTLEELLEELRADDTWLEGVAAEEEEHQRVTELLTELSKSSDVDIIPDKKDGTQDVTQEGRDIDSDDDSEEESMATEADYVLAKALDEVEWEKINRTPSPSPPPSSTPPGNAKQASQGGSVEAASDGPFSLPTVPSELQDQPRPPTPSSQAQSDVDFAASIASRMAALKVSGPRALPSAPTEAVDALGLPQAPTFAPADRPVPGLAKRPGLDDEKNWCVVCLEDGAVRCLGCATDDNVYCARCWKEMHVGPRAGYDERGHSWETFVSQPR
ncbi:hypothetical protein F4777DRAFT_13547 [Nemania sp. FL0916]|nr:hypothetical protein F4777DRAFT_13547 [Nemania sp. FL0916]